MWHIDKVEANNVASFKELEFAPTMGVTTLIFGNNQDNLDNQPSNGSGKSALIESISIAVLGDPLRKVKIDEIIRDDADEMRVKMYLWNDETKDQVSIERQFSRNNPQSITVTLNGTPVVQPTVLDYNRYILELIGVTREEFFSYYVLTESHYSSFFSASDRDKKAIINKFSNADMVDQAIEKLNDDMEPVNERLTNLKLEESRIHGAIDVLERQIEKAKEHEVDEARTKVERIENLKALIGGKRAEIRLKREEIQKMNEKHQYVNNTYQLASSYESNPDYSLEFCYQNLKSLVNENFPNATFNDWNKFALEAQQKIADIEETINGNKKSLEELNKRVENGNVVVQAAQEKSDECERALNHFMSEYETNRCEAMYVKDQIEANMRETQRKLTDLRKSISMLKNSIAGTVTCPKCSHQFVVGSSVDVDSVTKKIVEQESNYEAIRKENEGIDHYAEYNKMVESLTSKKRQYEDNADKAAGELRKYKNALQSIQNDISVISGVISSHRSTVESLSNQLLNIRKKMFNEVFEIIDDENKRITRVISQNHELIASYEGAIATYESQISELESQSGSYTVENLEKTLASKKVEMYAATSNVDSAQELYDEMVVQNNRFIRFKSVLANSKIAALGQMLNGILEQLGSDLRVRIDGYKTLRNGTVRDKITVAILKNGIEFGSSGKLSKGERTRIDTACIVAMSKLVNSKCDNEKGLDLLIMDEILSGVDEKGLVGIYEALNKLKVTTIVVSHNPIAQSYPHTLTVTKKNGISTL